MGTSVIPALIDALVTQASAALPAVKVFDGFGVSDSPGTTGTLMVGVDDPDTDQAASSGDGSQSMAVLATTRPRDQVGSLTCAALAWSGSTNQKAARDAAYGIVAAVENLLRADPTLGIGQPGRVVIQMGDDRLSQNQYDKGCDALVIFTVNFKARI